jgi:hypothetical protein
MSRRDSAIHYDEDVGDDYSADRGLHVSTDGTRVVGGLLNVRPQKRRCGLEDLPDVYADWTPFPEDDLDEVHAVAETVTSYNVPLDEDESEATKRKRYQSSVGDHFLFFFGGEF